MKLLFTLILFFVSILSARTIYVDNSVSNNGTGNLDAPYNTLQEAIANSMKNDTILVRGGTYEEGAYEIRTDSLTISSYPGEWAILKVPTDNSSIQYVIRYAIPITSGTINRLELIGGYYYCLKFESNWNWDASKPFDQRQGASNITIKNSKFHSSGRDCIKITPACNNLSFINCEIYNSGIRDDSNAEGIDNVNGSNMVVDNCYIHDIATNGIYAKGGAKNPIIKNSVVTNCGFGGIVGGFYTDAEWFNTDENPNYHESINPSFYNNYVINTGSAGIGLYGSLNAKIYNNTIINTGHTYQASIDIVSGDIWLSSTNSAKPKNRNAWIVNNLIYNNIETQAIFQIRENAIDSNSIINHNLFYSTGATEFELEDYQSWPAYTFEEYQQNTPYGENSINSDPLLDDNYHLTLSSPAIDAGYSDSVIFWDYDNHIRNGWDIGADEFSTSTNKKVPPEWSDEIVSVIQSSIKIRKNYLMKINNIAQVKKYLSINTTSEACIFNISGRHLLNLSSNNSNKINTLGKGQFVVVLNNGNQKFNFKLLLN